MPKYKGQGPREMSAIIYSLYMMCGDQLLKELFDITSDLQKTKFNRDAEDYPPFNLMRIYIPEADGRTDKRSKYIAVWFIS